MNVPTHTRAKITSKIRSTQQNTNITSRRKETTTVKDYIPASDETETNLFKMRLLFLLFLSALLFVQCSADTRKSPPHLQLPAMASKIDPDFSWIQRETGITPDWSVGLGFWSHFAVPELEKNPLHPTPWTSGKMLKFLRKLNETAFELHSVYQPQAVGDWLKGFMKERQDGNQEHQHIFHQTPYRITTIPADNLPNEMFANSRVTIVQPQAATFSGSIWMPDPQQRKDLQLESPKFMCYEMWLTETIHDVPEARKIGIFVQYDGITGALLQVFCMREQKFDCKDLDPTNSYDFTSLGWPSVNLLQLPQEHDTYSGPCQARIVHFPNGPDKAEVAWSVEDDLSYSTSDMPDHFLDVQFEDGVYVRLPKCLYVESYDDIEMEIGCARCTGGFHRLLASGNCNKNGFHTLAYECWKGESAHSKMMD